MLIEVKTLGAGTYDGDVESYDDLKKLCGKLAETVEGWMKLKTPSGLILLNKSNIVSIRKKR